MKALHALLNDGRLAIFVLPKHPFGVAILMSFFVDGFEWHFVAWAISPAAARQAGERLGVGRPLLHFSGGGELPRSFGGGGEPGRKLLRRTQKWVPKHRFNAGKAEKACRSGLTAPLVAHEQFGQGFADLARQRHQQVGGGDDRSQADVDAMNARGLPPANAGWP